MVKSKFREFMRFAKARPGLLAGRIVMFIGMCGFLASCYLYLSAHGGAASSAGQERPLSRAAQAEGMRMSAEVLAAVLSKEAEKTGQNDESLCVALKRIYPELSDSGYFVLWRGTVDVCSPLTPDTAGLDFGGRTDAHGAYFVRELEALAEKGGGFHNFTLSYDMPLGGRQLHTFESEFMAYVTPVFGTDLHLTLWRPVDLEAFSLYAELEEGGNKWSFLGLCMSGLSFLGISVLLRNFRE